MKKGGVRKDYQNPVIVGLVLLVAGVAVAMIQYKVPTIMTSLMELFSLDARSASWLMSIFTLVGIFVAVPSGMLAQRFGAKTMMIVACCIAAAGSFVGLLVGGEVVLIASRAIEGVGLTVLTTCGPLVVRRCVRPAKIGTAMGIWGIWGCVGSTVAAVIVPTIFEMVGFAGLWVAFASVVLVAALLVLVVIRVPDVEGEGRLDHVSTDAVPDVPRPHSDSTVGACGPRKTAMVSRPPYRELITRETLLFFVAFAIFNICLLAVLSFVPTILQMRGFGATLSGFISTLPMLLSIVSSPLFGVVSDRVGRCKPILVMSMLVMGPCTFLFFTQVGALLWIAAIVMGLIGMGGIGLFLSGYTRLVPDPALASLSMGIMILVQGIGQFLGSFLVQILLGPDLSHWTSAGLTLLGMGLVGTAALSLCRMR